MSKRVLYTLLLLFGAWLCVAEAYTVVLKNGRVMKGKLISETADGIIFQDDKGVQFSLKKSTLNLERMQTENVTVTPPASAPKLEEKEIAPTELPSQIQARPGQGRRYTREDLERLHEKYGELTTGEPSEPEEYSPSDYYDQLQEAAKRIPPVVQAIATFGHNIATTWEVAAAAKKDAGAEITAKLDQPDNKKLIADWNRQVSALDAVKGRLSKPTKGYEEAYERLSNAVSTTQSLYSSVLQHTATDAGAFRAQITAMETEVNSQVEAIQSLQPITAQPEPEKKIDEPNPDKEDNPEQQEPPNE